MNILNFSYNKKEIEPDHGKQKNFSRVLLMIFLPFPQLTAPIVSSLLDPDRCLVKGSLMAYVMIFFWLLTVQ